MSEQAFESIDTLRTGDTVEFEDITKISAFEDMVAFSIDPNMKKEQKLCWEGRIALRDLIRPAKFNGTFAAIQLEVAADPYERLYNARERGWKFTKRGGHYTKRLEGEFAAEDAANYHSFIFTAAAKSSGRGTIGQIQTELWYLPIPKYRHFNPVKHSNMSDETTDYKSDTFVRNYDGYAGASVRRIVAKPTLVEGNFVALNEDSRRIGFAVLRHNMRNKLRSF